MKAAGRWLLTFVGMLIIWAICTLGGVISSAWMFAAIVFNSPRGWVLAIAFDQLANAATGGDPDETISSRAARGKDLGIWRWCLLCKLLDMVEPGHCDKSRGV